jgi:Tol biopolymer transport system component
MPGELRPITRPGVADNRATYLPDGKTPVFASKRSGRSQLWASDPDGTHPRRLHVSTANDFGRVAASPNGTCICFSSDRESEIAVYVLDLASGNETRIWDIAFWSFGPTWSTGNLIAYFSKKGGNTLNIWTVRPDGSKARVITNRPGSCRQPWWSPDGNILALAADNGTHAFQIWLAAADGSNPRPITDHGTYMQPFWSPDGERIVVSAKIGDARFRIYVMNVDGADLRPIRQPEGVDNVHQAWSPDGRSIVFTSGMGDQSFLQGFDLA